MREHGLTYTLFALFVFCVVGKGQNQTTASNNNTKSENKVEVLPTDQAVLHVRSNKIEMVTFGLPPGKVFFDMMEALLEMSQGK